MANGYAGKILKVDLSTKSIEEIPTEKYESWGGGHGMGSAIFWDLCKDKTIKGDDPGNVLTLMTSPLSGTPAPSVAGRTEVQAIGLQGYPVGWYTRSNFGGRFSSHLKYAGWDGVVVLGKADKPVWINVVNDKVTIEDATGLWGLDTRETQEEIWATVNDTAEVGDWHGIGTSRDAGRSTQRPAVVTTGPNAEKYMPMASLVHDAGNGAGQGGMGGVFASKNLKAISVLGTGGVSIADPNALLAAREWAYQFAYPGHADEPMSTVGMFSFPANPNSAVGNYAAGVSSRPQGCVGCIRTCRGRTSTGQGNESNCLDFIWYDVHDKAVHGGKITSATVQAADSIQRYGINSFAMEATMLWFAALRKQGLIGPGLEIDSSLPFEAWGTAQFAEALCESILTQTDVGADLALGVAQCAKKWGRLEKDLASGILPLQEWGYAHHYDARTEVEWGYGSIMGERDINEHDFNWVVYWTPTICGLFGVEPIVSAERLSQIIAKKGAPYNDPMMADYSDEGIYSEGMAKTVAFHRHYTRFWKQSALYCDWAWADFVNPYGPDYEGITGEGEPKFFNAVTGKNLTYEEGLEIGRKIWNLDRAIWILQGRHREMEVLADYNYDVGAMPGTTTYEAPYTVPVYEKGVWSYKSVAGRKLDRQKVEDWKTKFYALEGWDTSSGWPTRATLEELGLGNVADTLEQAGKLGAA